MKWNRRDRLPKLEDEEVGAGWANNFFWREPIQKPTLTVRESAYVQS